MGPYIDLLATEGCGCSRATECDETVYVHKARDNFLIYTLQSVFYCNAILLLQRHFEPGTRAFSTIGAQGPKHGVGRHTSHRRGDAGEYRACLLQHHGRDHPVENRHPRTGGVTETRATSALGANADLLTDAHRIHLWTTPVAPFTQHTGSTPSWST